MTPALRALRRNYPQATLHLLVPEEIAPLFQHLAWLDRVWPMPRRRGSASLGATWPLIRALRRERFDRSVDFASNDRGAILSFLIGAKRRLGWAENGGFWGRQFFYHDRVVPEPILPHESRRLAQLLSGWQIPPPDSFEPEIRSDPALAEAAQKILPEDGAVICHVASSQQKKEWPLAQWTEFHRLATAAGYQLVFTTARGEREAALMSEFKKLVPARKSFAGHFRITVVSRGFKPGQFVYFRRYRSVAFCRRAGCADDFAVRPHRPRALGTHRHATSGFNRRRLWLRWPFRRLPGRTALPRGDFTATGFRRAANIFSRRILVNIRCLHHRSRNCKMDRR